ncbi:hypothetical protein K501DRAFT_267067 [Backusella circina FSU 941]|nr:hypothetical protein K501DRAFT_267067 [Backusella circina FSU 941]
MHSNRQNLKEIQKMAAIFQISFSIVLTLTFTRLSSVGFYSIYFGNKACRVSQVTFFQFTQIESVIPLFKAVQKITDASFNTLMSHPKVNIPPTALKMTPLFPIIIDRTTHICVDYKKMKRASCKHFPQIIF